MANQRGRCILCIGNDPVPLNLRCALLKKQGWRVVNSGSGHDGIIRFGQETVDAVVVDLNDDGAEAALITGELKRLRPEVPVVIVVTEGQTLANGATKQADVLVPKSRESSLLVEAVRAVLPQQ